MQSNPAIAYFSIAKFSYTSTSVDHSGPLAWTHVNTNGDLQCIFEKIAGSTLTGPPRLLLRVIRNDGILEQIDLLHFVRIFSNFSSPANGPRPTKQLFAVVVKSPCLAVKYPQSASYVRRFQIKFSRATDYFNALAHLSEINCPLIEGSMSQAPRRQTSSSTWASSVQMSAASVDESHAMTSSHTTPIPFFAMPSYAPGSITTPDPPPSSCTSTSYQRSIYQGPPPVYNPKGITPGNERPKQTTSKPDNVIPKLTRPTLTRPVSTPAYDEAQLDRMLPPKRDLPFLKPTRKGLVRQGSSNNVATIPTTAEEQIRVEVRTQSQIERYASLASDSQSQSLVPTQTYQDSLVTLSQDELEPSQVQQCPVSTPVPVSNHVMERGRLESMNVTAALSPEPAGSSDCVIIERGPAQLQHLQRPLTSEKNELSLYLSSPTAERTAFLQDWMCDLLQDDEFMTLCQDTEGVWKRFAFGIKP
ncbi:hypothetical protein N7495_004230 [Penicillium taxi]|uniref:uncharacterized protein n=1 Tax=Penicillium taxi TaxID=168475 RepID=UPI0025452706|nr:uncharacterized protein N7495_004230 [Penicillium taxi]KAJ5899486.1 hypothetical protein N7495_004230 [Penicillium taxi]